MKLAILGTDGDIAQLAAAARELGHEIAWVGDIRREEVATLRQLVAAVGDRAGEWELLLDHGLVDAVLVGTGTAPSDQRAEQLKRLTTASVPLLTVQPVLDSVLPYYEIDMTRRETGALVQHYNPLAHHPAAARLAEWARGEHAQVGEIHQLVCERRLDDTSRAAVLAAFARDVELIASVAGPIRRVSAIGPTSPDASFASLQVQMTSTTIPSLRWSVGTTMPTGALAQFTLLGERGSVALRELRADTSANSRWQIEAVIGDTPNIQPVEAGDPAKAAINRLAAAVSAADAEQRAALSTWEAATRAMEVVDAVDLSLQKGRTIEVFQQQLTERLAFRGTMAAFGCGLLLLAFFAVLVVAVLGGAEGIMQEKIVPSWPIIMLAGLAFFLLLQAVPFLVPKKDKSLPPKQES